MNRLQSNTTFRISHVTLLVKLTLWAQICVCFTHLVFPDPFTAFINSFWITVSWEFFRMALCIFVHVFFCVWSKGKWINNNHNNKVQMGISVLHVLISSSKNLTWTLKSYSAWSITAGYKIFHSIWEMLLFLDRECVSSNTSQSQHLVDTSAILFVSFYIRQCVGLVVTFCTCRANMCF